MTTPRQLVAQPVDLDGFLLDSVGLARLEALLGAGVDNEAAAHVIDHVVRLGARYAILESPYTDQDYSSDYVNFYASAFKDYPRRTKRVHFFDRDVSAIFQQGVADQVAALAKETSYLGFTVIRPIRQAPVGRTVLRFPSFGDGLTVRFGPRATFRIHILGAELEITGAPFIQQDSRVGACAQAAIWMACRPIYERHRTAGWHAVSDITRLAVTPTDTELSGALPHGSEGLSPIHIVRALRGMGHQPYCATFIDDTNEVTLDEDAADAPIEEQGSAIGDEAATDGAEPADALLRSAVPTIVRYLDSGLPVILGLADINHDCRKGHAITAVGYVEAEHPLREGDSYDCFVRALIVHDDQRGPYRLMPLTREDADALADAPLLRLRPEPVDESDAADPGQPLIAADDVTHVFVPLSPRVVRLGDHADLIARSFIEKLNGQNNLGATLRKLPKDAIDRLQSVLNLAEERHLVFRTYLTTGARYRHHLAINSLPEDVKARAINRELPHFIWVIELLDRDAVAAVPGGPRPLLGHIVVNATSAIESATDLLFAHLPHLDFQRDVNPADDSVDYVDHLDAVTPNGPYDQRIRS